RRMAMKALKTLTPAIPLAAVGTAALAALPHAAGAAQREYQQGQAAAAPLSADTRQAFGEAAQDGADVRDDCAEMLSKPDTQEDAQKLQLEAQEKMVEAVQDADLDVATYNEIATRIQTDPELQQRAESHR